MDQADSRTGGAASTAAALAGLSTQQIMARAGWSSEDTFSRHYYKPSAEADNAMKFGQAVLNNSTNMQRTCWLSRSPPKYNLWMAKAACSCMLSMVVRGGWRWDQHVLPALPCPPLLCTILCHFDCMFITDFEFTTVRIFLLLFNDSDVIQWFCLRTYMAALST